MDAVTITFLLARSLVVVVAQLIAQLRYGARVGVVGGLAATVLVALVGACAPSSPPRHQPPCRPALPVLASEALVGQVGTAIEIDATMPPASYARVATVELVVGAPDTWADIPEDAETDPHSVRNPQNQLALSTAGNLVPDGQRIQVSFTPRRPGDYPVIAVVTFETSLDCEPPGPATVAPDEGRMLIGQIGVIHVDGRPQPDERLRPFGPRKIGSCEGWQV